MRYLLHLHPDLTIVFQYYLERTYMKDMERIYHGKTNREKHDSERKKMKYDLTKDNGVQNGHF